MSLVAHVTPDAQKQHGPVDGHLQELGQGRRALGGTMRLQVRTWRGAGEEGTSKPGPSPARWRCAPGSLTAGSQAWRASCLVPHSTARPGQKDRCREQRHI